MQNKRKQKKRKELAVRQQTKQIKEATRQTHHALGELEAQPLGNTALHVALHNIKDPWPRKCF